MLVVIFLSALYCVGNCENFLKYQSNTKPALEKCIVTIVKKFFVDHNHITYFNIDIEDDHILAEVHSTETVALNLGIFKKTKTSFKKGYIIVAKNEKQLFLLFSLISRGNAWQPNLRFLIVVSDLQEKQKVFDTLLKLHVIHVVVVNGTETAELFTYNPFDNFACGKYYSEITEFGKCSDVESVNIYPHKLLTELRNCTFNVSCAHWPPWTLDPNLIEDGPNRPLMGTEQYIFDLISHVEQFKYNFKYDYDPELFSIVSNETVSGPLAMIERNQTDVILGGLVLSQARANKFAFIFGHLDQIDDIRVIVKKASITPAWKNLYVEFSPVVWLLVLLAMILYAVLLVKLLREKDNGRVLLILFDNMLLHGGKIHVRHVISIVVMFWIWFAYLVNNFYQCSLVSLTMKPSLEYQIKDEEGLKAYGLKPCISQVMQGFTEGESLKPDAFHNKTMDESCAKQIKSIRTVSKAGDRYAVSPYGIFLFNEHKFYNQYGEPVVYPFPKPFNKLIYAIYLYKGFPREEKLHKLALRIRETGLTDKSLNDQYFLQAIKFRFNYKPMEMRFAVPWHIYFIGMFISTLAFIVEVVSVNKRKENKSKSVHNRLITKDLRK